MGRNVAIVLAAGRGKRMGSDVAKQYLHIGDKPVLFYALKTFEDSFMDEIILVTGAGEEEYCRNEIVERYHFNKVKKIVPGGVERYHSVLNGLRAAKECEYVFIHDGARPFITEEILLRNLECVQKYEACVTGMPVKDTIKKSSSEGFVEATPERKTLWAVQTPQTFSYKKILDAYEKFLSGEGNKEGVEVTDDAMVAEIYGNLPVKLVEGSYENIKITTPGDLVMAEALLEAAFGTL